MVLANTESIRIWQQNTRKSLTAQLATLHSVRDEYDIICIQEPHMDFQAMSRATSVWTAVYPSSFKHDKDGPPARALTLVRTRISTNNWTQTPIDSLDVVAICLTSARGTLHVYNIYNDCTHSDTIYTLSRHLQARSRRNRQRTGEDAEGGDIWLGDFNRHNPWWEDARTPGSSPREIWTTRKSSSIYWQNLTWTWHSPLSSLQSPIPEAAKQGQTTSL